MKIVHTIAAAREACRALTGDRRTLGFVPTMGALHAGHMSLVAAAHRTCDAVAASIFVNPTQFGPTEDLAKYPRTLDADCALLSQAGVALLFAPSAAEMYPDGGLGASVDPGPLGDRLDGQSRPGHFRGVATVVAKLFHIIGADRAFFGQKDAAQVAVLRAMVRDLDLPIELVVCPTIRESDGLALSSRNRYLSPPQRNQARVISQALFAAHARAIAGESDAISLAADVREHLASAGLRVDYAQAVDPDTLLPVSSLEARTLLAVAAWLGDTRLIDNVLLEPLPGVADPSGNLDRGLDSRDPLSPALAGSASAQGAA